MTPQERKLVAYLFDRLASLEGGRRDVDAERAIADGLRRAPNAIYALVQTALVQDEALKQADARIRELQGGGAPANEGGGFLDTMRDALLGREPRPQGSVPQVRSSAWNIPANAGTPAYPPTPPYAPPQQGVGLGGSFLGTAAAAAAGVIGGGLLMNSFRSMFGGAHGMQSALDPSADTGRQPWGGDASNSDLARDAGLNDIGSTRQTSSDDRTSAGLFGGADSDSDGPVDSSGGFDDSTAGFDDTTDA
jgi:hypothetical protein